jgi:outer membrane protein assembly factor BamE (lipoprotein component of BamABCDE complex)
MAALCDRGPRLAAAGVLMVSMLALFACTPEVATRGNMVDPDSVQEIKPGETTQSKVADLLGTPSAIGTFDDKSWYYIGRKTRKVAFFEPTILDQEVVAIKFDDSGVVSDLKVLGTTDARTVELVDRTTPTTGRQLGVFQQLLGNLGRFNNAAPAHGSAPGSLPKPGGGY